MNETIITYLACICFIFIFENGKQLVDMIYLEKFL